ncbi:unnamed protein product [Brassicogethes aeneus]|uniref:Amino acid transporter transmembrane domain-containing protein n=1 Tax=Brassicogethes aeneus TaxID=1431903 RepID=A0A9P0BEG0_BRAAE|nr:unnamed protein product [Brassicogethes aeneus]
MSKKTKAIGLDNFGSTATLANNEVSVPLGSQDTLNEKDYDPYEHRNVLHSNTYFGALVHLLKCSLGTGILAIPRAFKASGLAVGVVGTVFIGILCTYTIHILMVASLKMCKLTKKPGLDFSETIFEIVKHGPKGCRKYARSAKIFVESGLLLSHNVVGSVFIVFISTSIKQLMDQLYPELIEYSGRWYMVIIMVLLIIFCQVRELKHMIPFSFTANAMMVIAFGITLYYIFLRMDNVDFKEIKMVGSLTGMPVFFSTVMFAMGGNGSILPLENTMIKPQFLGCFGCCPGSKMVHLIGSILHLHVDVLCSHRHNLEENKWPHQRETTQFEPVSSAHRNSDTCILHCNFRWRTSGSFDRVSRIDIFIHFGAHGARHNGYAYKLGQLGVFLLEILEEFGDINFWAVWGCRWELLCHFIDG